MDFSSPENDAKFFGFHDLHSFKDYVAFVRLCAPNDFPYRSWRKPDEQMTLDRAFVGLRNGLNLTALEKGDLPILPECRSLVEEAYAHYREGRVREGYFKLQEMEKLLKRVPSQ